MGRSKTARFVIAILIVTGGAILGSCSWQNQQKPEEALKADPARVDTSRGEVIDTQKFVLTDSTIRLRSGSFPKPGGRVVNMMITGVDSRLGDPTMHADANHLVRFFLDSGCIEIISLPRDTYADAGFDDTTGLNRLTNVRANRGRNEYHAAVMEITGVAPINYWVEFGFSQAIGLLEILGFKNNATSTLKVLRSRQAFSTGDFQRSYNQGEFIRQILLKNVKRSTSVIGDLAIRAALMLVETNMSFNDAAYILEELNTHGFTDDASRVWVRVEPPVVSKFITYQFDSTNIAALDRKIDSRIKELGLDSLKSASTYEQRLVRLIEKASADSARSASSVIRILRRPYEQKAWLQITEHRKRIEYRDRLCSLLEDAYRRRKNIAAADRIRTLIAIENQINGDK